MKKVGVLAAFTIVSGLGALDSQAGTISAGAGSPPTLGTYDQSQTVVNDNLSLDGNASRTNPGVAWQGQTFTVPAGVGAGGAYLNSFSVDFNNWSGSPRTFEAQVVTIAGGSTTPGNQSTVTSILADDTATVSGGSAGWLTFTFDPSQDAALTAGATYGFQFRDIDDASTPNVYGDLNYNSDQSSYSGGIAYTVDLGQSSPVQAYGRNFQRDFVANLAAVPVPEPTAFGALVVGGSAMLGLRRRRTVKAV